MAFLSAFMLVILMSVGGLAFTVDQDEPVVAVVSGSFYALDTLSGLTQHRLNRRHLGAMNDSHISAMRLDLGPEVAALDMELSQDSVWTEDSVLVIRRGEEVEEIHDAVDSACFLSGRLTSHAGAASINRCGKMTGLIQTDDFIYEIEEAENGNLDAGVKVTMKRSKDITSSEDGVIVDQDDSGLEDNMDLGEILTKRQQRPIAAEVAVFVDANFARWQASNKGRSSDTALTQWIVRKWNVIRGVYGNAREIGVPFKIELKKVEIWRRDPSYYSRLGSNAKTFQYISAFCGNTSPSPNYDHKMLYTQGMGQHHMGMAFLNKICRPTKKCSLSKAKGEGVKLELHEFGHNLGLSHDPQLQPCTDSTGAGGFMGWGNNYRILDCYKRRLLETLNEPGARCLYQKNVNLNTLNQ